ncbi:hypothetical protein [Fodinicola feengrottensis]|uniref:hypothetical protein n=1 Tax=Fodinicola feengrottensis TaxID=435914 RepID=UPI0013D380BE|nr:hypothetical protein [Fodinicola feengrottensis]
MFTLSGSSLTIPAGGQADLTLTAKTRVAGPDGQYARKVVATAGGQSVSTPFEIVREQESYNVTVHGVGIDGNPAGLEYVDLIINYTSGMVPNVPQDMTGSGTVVVRLPKGHYSVQGVVDLSTPDLPRTADLHAPSVMVDRDISLTVDARKAAPVKFSVQDPGFSCQLPSYHYQVAGRFDDEIYLLNGSESLYLGNIGPASAPSAYRGMVAADCDSSAAAAPPAEVSDFYHIAVPTFGKAPDGAVVTASKSSFAKLTGKHIGVDSDAILYHSADVQFAPGMPARWNGFGTEHPLAAGSDDYFSPHAGWWVVGTRLTEPGKSYAVSSQNSQPRRFLSGHTYSEVWNKGIYGPSFRAASYVPATRSAQYPDRIVLVPWIFSDSDPAHSGYAFGDGSAGRIILYREGIKVAEDQYPFIPNLEYEAPATAAKYRLAVAVNRPFGPMSTNVSASWTFRSQPTTNVAGVPLPLYALRYGAKLDASQGAAAGRYTIPVYVDRQIGVPNLPVVNPTLEYSTDDGTTWQKTPAIPTGYNRWNVTVANPSSGFVSLRATATDTGGTSVTQTIIRAYAIH